MMSSSVVMDRRDEELFGGMVAIDGGSLQKKGEGCGIKAYGNDDL